MKYICIEHFDLVELKGWMLGNMFINIRQDFILNKWLDVYESPIIELMYSEIT